MAVKTFNNEVMDAPGVWQCFVFEAHARRQLASSGTAAVLTVDFDARPPYIVSEYVDGLSLHNHMSAGTGDHH